MKFVEIKTGEWINVSLLVSLKVEEAQMNCPPGINPESNFRYSDAGYFVITARKATSGTPMPGISS
jgi:hypothetical protein